MFTEPFITFDDNPVCLAKLSHTLRFTKIRLHLEMHITFSLQVHLPSFKSKCRYFCRELGLLLQLTLCLHNDVCTYQNMSFLISHFIV